MRRLPIKPSVAVALFYCVFATAFILGQYAMYRKFDNDFSVYWRAAHQQLDQVYFWKGRYPFPYAPTMLMWISPLKFVARWPAYFVWTAISVSAFVLAFRRHVPKGPMALTLISPPVARGVATGQVCCLLAAMALWSCRTSNRIAAGIAFGLIASVKPQVVLMAPLVFLLNRDWRALFASVATFAATIALSLLFFGPERWPEWIGSMSHFQHTVVDSGVVSVAVTPAAVARYFDLPPLPFLVAGIAGGIVIVWSCRDSEPLENAAAITIGSIMASPYALVYDLTAVVPLLALAVFEGRLLPAIGMATGFHPVPLLVSIWELVRGKLWQSETFSTASLRRFRRRSLEAANARMRSGPETRPATPSAAPLA